MANINDVLRRTSGYVDSSGKYPPPAIQTQAIMSLGGGYCIRLYAGTVSIMIWAIVFFFVAAWIGLMLYGKFAR